jgi:hypothetical protein
MQSVMINRENDGVLQLSQYKDHIEPFHYQ